ncbi:MAG: glycosyltransferase family 4 protein [Lachnospiraceae bacterium]|nr:glycosyltransferase family 4 protein [Lachnospiraceae bacterium]
MKIVIFGVGKFYQERKEKIPSEIEIVAFLDNNKKLQGSSMADRPIISPGDIKQLSYDKIILMSASEEAMKSQLLELGIGKREIWYWEEFVSAMNRGLLKLYCGNNKTEKFIKRILIISTDIEYNGGTIAALYAARALQESGNLVVLAAPDGNKIFINEITDCGVNVVLCPALPYVGKEELFWIQQFDVVLVNVFQMALCACEISKIRPAMWWIHEPRDLYNKVLKRFQGYINKDGLENINIYAVSSIAETNFNFHFPNTIEHTLPYGIPDENKDIRLNEKTDTLVFAIVGTVCVRKAQDIFVKAVGLLNTEDKKNVQFWIIGSMGIDEYCTKIKKMVSKNEKIKIIGPLTRSEICEVYRNIDVVVCPSLEDPLPIVATEGMMYGKTCIVSDKTGTASYLKNGETGFICKAGDPSDLSEKMRYIIHNQNKLQGIGREARKIYDKYFSMESFGERLEIALKETIDNWSNNQ